MDLTNTTFTDLYIKGLEYDYSYYNHPFIIDPDEGR
jgi:hypothetical protein